MVNACFSMPNTTTTNSNIVCPRILSAAEVNASNPA